MRAWSLRIGGVCALVLATACTERTEQAPRERSEEAATGGFSETSAKRALIVAVGDYPAEGGYAALSSTNDVPLVQGALRQQGFGAPMIRVVTDADATREGILGAIRQHLIEPAEAGDVVFFHYSGHGHRLTDDNGDELDGYDETLVPYDAPKRLSEGYAGERHIRDDELNALVNELRKRVGPDGNVVVSVDACNSGSATRGLAVRGVQEPLGPPASVNGSADDGGGFFEPTEAAISADESGEVGPDPQDAVGLAPYAVFSAARHDELAWEVWSDEGVPVGSLSFALSKALAKAEPGTSYRALFDGIKEDMATLVPLQTPQLEGDSDTEIFSGRVVRQNPYLDVEEVLGDTVAVLRAGTLLAVHPGTEVAFHPAGTVDPVAVPTATGVVERATPARAIVRFDGAPLGDVSTSWAFVTRYGFGDLGARTRIDASVDPAVAARVRQALDTSAVASVVDGTADVVLTASGGRLELRTTTDDRLLLGVDPSAAPRLIIDGLLGRLRSYARSRYVARIDMDDPGTRVRLEVVPTEHQWNVAGDCVSSAPLPEQQALSEGNQWEFGPGDEYVLRIRNEGSLASYVSILSVTEDGGIGQLFPHPANTGQDNYIEPGDAFEIDLCYTVTEPYGVELLKLFATRERVDFWPLLQEGVDRSSLDSALNPLETILADAYRGTRSDLAGPPRASGSTFGVTINVVRR